MWLTMQIDHAPPIRLGEKKGNMIVSAFIINGGSVLFINKDPLSCATKLVSQGISFIKKPTRIYNSDDSPYNSSNEPSDDVPTR